jgi:hypothetical protein
MLWMDIVLRTLACANAAGPFAQWSIRLCTITRPAGSTTTTVTGAKFLRVASSIAVFAMVSAIGRLRRVKSAMNAALNSREGCLFMSDMVVLELPKIFISCPS